MALTTPDKIKILNYLKTHAVGEIYYGDMCDLLSKKVKPTDLEFLDYFTNYTVDLLRKDEKISIKMLTKLIAVIGRLVGWINEDNKEIPDTLLDKIRCLDDFYDDYLNRNEYLIDIEFTDDYLEPLIEMINDLYPCEEVVADGSETLEITVDGDESVSSEVGAVTVSVVEEDSVKKPVASDAMFKYINEIDDLNKKIKALERDLEQLQSSYDVLQSTADKRFDRITELSREIGSLSSSVATKERDIVSLETIITDLRTQLSDLQSELETVSQERDSMSPLVQKCEKLTSEVARLTAAVDEDIRIKTNEALRINREKQIEAIIYQKIMLGETNIEALIKELKRNGFVSDKDETYSALRKIKSMINIETSSFSISPSYSIVVPTISEGRTLNIDVPSGCKHYDFMLTADFHTRTMGPKEINAFQLLNDYCQCNDIHMILNIGDFFDCIGGHAYEYENAVANYELVERAISLIPRVDGIYHAVLGGNHDKNVLQYGFDPIKMLTEAREDFIDLGYTNATIALNGTTSLLGTFDIHHPQTFDFGIEMTEEGIDFDGVNKYLNKVYRKQSRSRDNSYVDIFGHTHRSQINNPGGFAYIPAFCNGGGRRGACHLRIYLDETTGIKYMVFMPLSITNRLTKANEIVYQKLLTR